MNEIWLDRYIMVKAQWLWLASQICAVWLKPGLSQGYFSSKEVLQPLPLFFLAMPGQYSLSLIFSFSQILFLIAIQLLSVMYPCLHESPSTLSLICAYSKMDLGIGVNLAASCSNPTKEDTSASVII